MLPGISFHYSDVLALVFVTSLSLGIPTVPGAVGVFEATVVFYLSAFLNVAAEEALACAIILHLCIAVPQIGLMMIAPLATKIQKRLSR